MDDMNYWSVIFFDFPMLFNSVLLIFLEFYQIDHFFFDFSNFDYEEFSL